MDKIQMKELKRDPSRPLSDVQISTYREKPRPAEAPAPPLTEEEPIKPWWKFCYDKDTKTFCDRTCASWCHIIAYSIFYLIFLCTYTLMLLYLSLLVVKSTEVYNQIPDRLVLAPGYGRIGLTATPTSVNKMNLIWYEEGESRDYEKYVTALEKLVSKRDSGVNKELGPCGAAPFGYGEAPCVIVRINKHYGSSGLPLSPQGTNFSDIPSKVKQWAKTDSKLWLHCDGNNPYDAEHIGTIKYYPDPPGFNPGVYAPGNDSNTPLIAVQFSNFTKGMTLAVECILFYDGGTSTVDFVLYVSSSRKFTFA